MGRAPYENIVFERFWDTVPGGRKLPPRQNVALKIQKNGANALRKCCFRTVWVTRARLAPDGPEWDEQPTKRFIFEELWDTVDAKKLPPGQVCLQLDQNGTNVKRKGGFEGCGTLCWDTEK